MGSAVFLSVSALSFMVVRKARSQSEPHKPFKAVEVEKRYDASGVERYQEQKIYAMRSDGSSIWFASRMGPDGKAYTIGDIYDLSAKRVITVDGFTQSTTTEALTPSELAFQQRVDPSCQSASEGSTLLGQNVFKVSQVLGPADSWLLKEEWAAPAFDCYVLSGSYFEYLNGQPGPKTTRETKFLIPGEPPASLFSIPAAYVERSPSEVAAEFERRFGKRPAFQADTARADEKYAVRHLGSR